MSSLKEYLDNKNNKESNISTIPEGSTDVKDLAKLNLLPRTKLENYTEIKGIGNNPNYNLNFLPMAICHLVREGIYSIKF